MKKQEELTTEPTSTALIVRPEFESAILDVLGDGYTDEMMSQQEGLIPVMPAVKSLKEYKNLVYEPGQMDDDGQPKRIEITDVKGLVVFDHSMRAIFYEREKHGSLWANFPTLDPNQVLTDYTEGIQPLCSAVGGVPNRAFAFAAKCSLCPLNSFGSPCKPKQRLFMLMDAKTDSGPITNEMVTFTLPTTSIKFWTGKPGVLNELKLLTRTTKMTLGIPYYALWMSFPRSLETNEKKQSYYVVHPTLLKTDKGELSFVSREMIAEVKTMRDEMKRIALKVRVDDWGGPDQNEHPNSDQFH